MGFFVRNTEKDTKTTRADKGGTMATTTTTTNEHNAVVDINATAIAVGTQVDPLVGTIIRSDEIASR